MESEYSQVAITIVINIYYLREFQSNMSAVNEHLVCVARLNTLSVGQSVFHNVVFSATPL